MRISKPIATASKLQAPFTSAGDAHGAEGGCKPIHVTLSLDPKLHRRLKLAAAMQGATMSEMVSTWIERECPAMPE